MNENTTTQDEVIDVLREGRATPRYIEEETSIESKQNAQYHLRQLRAEDRVEKVSRGLYELVSDPRMDAYHESMETMFEAAMEEIADEPAVDIDPTELEFDDGDKAGDNR